MFYSELLIPLKGLVGSVKLPTGVVSMTLVLLIHSMQEVSISDSAHEEASLVKQGNHSSVLLLNEVTYDLVVEVLDLMR